MAVYKRAYRPYDGPLTAERCALPGAARATRSRSSFESRVLLAFLVLCFVPFLVGAGGRSTWRTARPRARCSASRRAGPTPMHPRVLRWRALTFQGVLAFFLTAWVAPVLVSPDLVNGALPLYLSRPFSRAEYVLGKAAVLVALLSVDHLGAGPASSSPPGRPRAERLARRRNLRVAWATLVGAWIWIAVLTLLGLALSAWIRWRLVASAALFGVFFMGSAFGEMWREVLRDLLGPAGEPRRT